MKASVIRWLAVFNILVLCCGILAFFMQRHRQQQAHQAQQTLTDRIVQEGIKNDDATPDQRAQLDEISKNVRQGQAPTDDQFSFLLMEVGKQNDRGIGTASHLYATMILDHIKAPLPTSQKVVLYNRMTPLLQIKDPTVSSGITLAQMHKLEACDLLARYDVRAAIPQIVPLLDDPKPQIRVNAKRALKRLGYSI